MAVAGCGSEDGERPVVEVERGDRPAELPKGWRRVTAHRAGFTVGMPPGWSASKRAQGTLLRSDDKLVALTLGADRTEVGRGKDPAAYAEETFTSLSGFRDLEIAERGEVEGSPYGTALVEGRGVLEPGGREQLISVAAIQRPGQVTFTAVAFVNARVLPRLHARDLDRILASLRARTPQF